MNTIDRPHFTPIQWVAEWLIHWFHLQPATAVVIAMIVVAAVVVIASGTAILLAAAVQLYRQQRYIRRLALNSRRLDRN